MATKTGYKFVRSNMQSEYGTAGKWTVGKPKKVTLPLSLCHNGFHASEEPAQAYNYGSSYGDNPRLFKVKASGKIVSSKRNDGNTPKFCAEEMVLVKEIPLKTVLPVIINELFDMILVRLEKHKKDVWNYTEMKQEVEEDIKKFKKAKTVVKLFDSLEDCRTYMSFMDRKKRGKVKRMFKGEIKDLEQRANNELGNVTTFITQLQDAKKSAESIDKDADSHIARLRKVKANSATVVSFVDTVLKNVKAPSNK